MSYYQGSCRLYFLPYSNDMFVGNVNTGNLYDGLALTGDLADKVANNLEEGEEAFINLSSIGIVVTLIIGIDFDCSYRIKEDGTIQFLLA